jgi:putative FmdB family regulatory protein
VPTYAYACTNCDHSFDLVQSFSEDPLTICPECEGRLRKVYGSIGITFKGSGFYRTDSRSSASIRGSSGGGSDGGKSDGGGSAGSTKNPSGGSDGGKSDGGGSAGSAKNSSGGKSNGASASSGATAASSA